MTQPPDDLERKPDGTAPDDPTAPENQPTVAWTPPGAPPPDAPAAAATPPATPWETPATPPPASPIISASPSVAPDASGQLPPTSPTAPVVGWAAPPPPTAAPGREGFVIAGIGARIVAYLIDALLVGVVPTVITFFVVDYASLFRDAFEASRNGTSGSVVMTVTPELILLQLISIAISFIYFVGFWTSGGRATPGMRGLRMQVVDAPTGGTLSLGAAVKRWAALGAPLSLLALIPAFQSLAGILQFALLLFLFFTVITNDRRQGLHDKFANSLVIRSASSGDGATVIGCLLVGLLVVGLAIVGTAALFAAVGPQMEELMREMGNSI